MWRGMKRHIRAAIIVSAALALAATCAEAQTWTRVTGCVQVENGVSTVQCALAGAQVGDVIVGAVTQNDSNDVGRSFTSVGDGGSTCTAQAPDVTGFVDMRGFTCVVNSSGTKNITVVYGGTETTGIIADLVRGIDTSTTVRGYAIQGQTSVGSATDSISSGSGTSAAGDYVFAATAFPGSGLDVSPGTSFTQGNEHVEGVTGDATAPMFSEYRNGTTTSHAGTMTANGDSNWKTMMISLQPSGGGGTLQTRLLLGVGHDRQ